MQTALPGRDRYGSLGGGAEGSSGAGNGNLSVLGSYYFISTHNGSTDIVTDNVGKAVTYFAYDPYGKVNRELTSLDPDGNGVQYGENFQFTGQELESETGLYNYHARIYDPETGRFLQPDPVHSENAGMDNWDRYQYVWNNPVNFTDPTGMRGNAIIHNFNKGLRNLFHGLNKTGRNIAHRSNGLINRISEGKKHDDPTDAVNVGARKLREGGTFIWRNLTDPGRLFGTILGILDLTVGYVAACINGQDKPTLHYSNGGWWIENSQFFPQYKKFFGTEDTTGVTFGATAFTPNDSSLDTIRHEKGHIQQLSHNGLRDYRWSTDAHERDNDYRQFTFGYSRPIEYLLLSGNRTLRYDEMNSTGKAIWQYYMLTSLYSP